LSATGTPNGVLDVGEDFNLNGTLQNYGQTPLAPSLVPGGVRQAWTALTAPYGPAAVPTARPWNSVDPALALNNPPAVRGRPSGIPRCSSAARSR